MSALIFTKMAASGNDFIVVDDIDGKLDYDKAGISKAAKRLCPRRFGVGADGMLYLEGSKNADFRMRVFNPDGSEAEMCGNGLRCAALYASAKDKKIKLSVETLAGILDVSVSDGKIKAGIPDPKDMNLDIDMDVAGERSKVYYVNTGVPHAVCFTPDINGVDVKNTGGALRRDEKFKPAGANVDFVKVTSGKSINIRTYERGVEDETLACGTGAVAAALISARVKGLKSPVRVKTTGGEELSVYFDYKNGSFSDVYIEGTAEKVYQGRVEDV
ncbi:MAG: diaminopimelate epimerase [Candidatus Omnitrophica bacterium CG1_02_49_10]|nr:MAG: diaminopimelate epimerase [Candidatus Omnitrophica bacterium CG1_02_49_10]